MFLLALLILCVMTVPLLGGRLHLLSEIQFRRSWAGVLAVVIQTLIMAVFPGGDGSIHEIAHLSTYALMFYFLAANLWIPGAWLIGLGGACNAIAIAANNGVMPARPEALATAGIVSVPGEFANSAAVENAKLWFLGDVWGLPADWPMANVFSIGDILLILGAFVLLHRVSQSRLAPQFLRFYAWVNSRAPRMELLRENQPFRRLFIAHGITSVGNWIYPVAVFTAFVDDDTKASSLAFLLIAEVAPAFLVGLFCGPLIDRFSRKKIMFWADVVRGLALASLLLSPDPAILHFYAVAAILGVGIALQQPAFQATLPNLVRTPLLASANAAVGAMMSLAIMVGGPLGAGIVNVFGLEWAFAANAASFLFSAALVWGTAVPSNAVYERAANLWLELKEGLAYVVRHAAVIAAIIVVILTTVAAGFKQPFEPLFAIRTLDAGPEGLALLGSMWGAGMILGAVWASKLDRRLGHARLMTWSVALVGGAVALGATMPTLLPVLALWLLAGMGNTFGTVAYETLLQEESPDHVRGRVFAAVEAAIQAGILCGLLLSALSEPLLASPGDGHARTGLFLAGILFLVAAGASWWLLQRRAGRRLKPLVPAFELRGIDLRPTGTSFALLRVETAGADAAPVLVIDDGAEEHRLEALPGGGNRFGYGIPQRLLALGRARFTLEFADATRLDVPVPRGA